MGKDRIGYHGYIESDFWYDKRARALAQSGYKCERCGARGHNPETDKAGYGYLNSNAVELHVHHKTYKRLGEERDSDLEVLCKDCHKQHHKNGAEL